MSLNIQSLLQLGMVSVALLHATPLLAQVDPDTQALRHPESLEQQLKASDLSVLAREVKRRGDPRRGALVFYKSAAACVQCHASGDQTTPLGPDLTSLRESKPGDTGTAEVLSAEHLIESILFPSKKISQGYETVSILTGDGQLITGLIARQDDAQVVLRDANDLLHEIVIDRDDIEAMRTTPTSMMPDGLVAVIGGQREFYDLASYVVEVVHGGHARAAELKPSADQLLVVDDTENLDHAGIISKLARKDFAAGELIYHGYCFNCHGSDGNTPSLPTARAFGTQTLKFGADPYRMFLTLSKGNGLMAPMNHLTPYERYQVVHYIREQFVKPGKLDDVKVDRTYLEGLPKGTDSGERVLSVERDFGPALASQLGRNVNSALTVRLGSLTLSYNLHRMDIAGIWSGGFLNLDQTQHIRGRGEGTADPAGPMIEPLSYWRWGHGGTLDYDTSNLLPRGPMPENWLDYHGHYLHGDQVVISYAIDRREILEVAEEVASVEDAAGLPPTIVQTLRIGPGPQLLLAVGELGDMQTGSNLTGAASAAGALTYPIDSAVIDRGDDAGKGYFAAGLLGDRESLTWSVDAANRLVLTIPASDAERVVQVARQAADRASDQAAENFANWIQRNTAQVMDPAERITGGPLRWPDVLSTTGYPGLERGAYALDTLTIPDSTPWNTWFRTSAIDFFPDGRMVLTTYGGDVWIVSGVDNDLLDLRWKRVAGGLYEPMGVKVVDGLIYVTGKDRITRLHDLNGDGEADFYESFAADPDVSVNFHAFNFDLQVDSEGNFYYAKGGHGADTELPGVVYKVSPDGKYHEVYSTGFRTPNGMGILPDDRVTASDNQGQWTPASKINLLRPGGFYGWVQTYDGKGKWAPGGGAIALDRVVAPKSFNPPLVWMPQVLDNSSGGQLWAGDSRWGPLSGRLLHTSFGRGWMYYLMIQDGDDIAQAAIIKLPFDFKSGIMRAAVNPADGQVYATGLDGWNGGGRAGLIDHAIQRLRYTGESILMISDCQVEPEGLRLTFNFPLDPAKASRLDSYQVRHWNYLWQASYGSEMYSPTTGKVGAERMNIIAAEVATDARSVLLRVPDLKPVHQVHLLLDVASDSGESFAEEIYWTINEVPKHHQ
jgi:putative heme-binding domain-containing protein